MEINANELLCAANWSAAFHCCYLHRMIMSQISLKRVWAERRSWWMCTDAKGFTAGGDFIVCAHVRGFCEHVPHTACPIWYNSNTHQVPQNVRGMFIVKRRTNICSRSQHLSQNCFTAGQRRQDVIERASFIFATLLASGCRLCIARLNYNQ